MGARCSMSRVILVAYDCTGLLSRPEKMSGDYRGGPLRWDTKSSCQSVTGPNRKACKKNPSEDRTVDLSTGAVPQHSQHPQAPPHNHRKQSYGRSHAPMFRSICTCAERIWPPRPTSLGGQGSASQDSGPWPSDNVHVLLR